MRRISQGSVVHSDPVTGPAWPCSHILVLASWSTVPDAIHMQPETQCLEGDLVHRSREVI